jgi:hypothetical protein
MYIVFLFMYLVIYVHKHAHTHTQPTYKTHKHLNGTKLITKSARKADNHVRVIFIIINIIVYYYYNIMIVCFSKYTTYLITKTARNADNLVRVFTPFPLNLPDLPCG